MSTRARLSIRRALGPMLLALPALSAPFGLQGQWLGLAEQFYLPAPHNWAFRDGYPAADRLFNAFDYGHAILYETFWARPEAPVSELEQRQYDFITRKLLPDPPRLPLVEEAIQGQYAKLAPEAKMMFEWAHLLHRQVYDVFADDDVRDKDAAVNELVRYYRSRPDLAFSSAPKSMVLMEGQPYSMAFRERYPKFNGLIWAYHWLQVGLYEPLVVGRTPEERRTGLVAAVARFWSMLENPPARMPGVMPMTAAVAPEFARRHPDAAAIFDNLHAMHDVISDILASPVVARERKREAILEATARYRDDTTESMTRDAWLEMAQAMGVNNMGGAAYPILSPPPAGSTMGGMQHGAAGEHGGNAGAGDDRAVSERDRDDMNGGREAMDHRRTQPPDADEPAPEGEHP